MDVIVTQTITMGMTGHLTVVTEHRECRTAEAGLDHRLR